MALCHLCKSIPFDDLPVLDLPLNGTLIGDNEELPQVWLDSSSDSEPAAFENGLGFAWHKNLVALAAAASSGCSLCSLLSRGVDTWVERFEHVEKNNKSWPEFRQDCEAIPHGQTLWLVKRLGGGDGLIVLVFDSDRQRRINVLTGVAFSVNHGHPLAGKLPLRPIDPDSSSQASLEIAASWLNNCVKTHKQCPNTDTSLPSRVLDVGSSSDDTIKLIDGTTGLTGKYTCLSHCWGSSTTFMTTKESYPARISGITLSDLPKTFADAITITRHLGIRYLWIDSVCIFQDDEGDWARESSRMTAVYSNAHLVIAANQAKDSRGGCFHTRPPRPEGTIELPGIGEVRGTLLNPSREWVPRWYEFRNEPLSERGWALQERVLARRILHYNTTQMYFECDHGVTGEDGCASSERFCGLNNPHRISKITKYNYWHELLWAYGCRKLTKASDKLPAISGLAKLIEGTSSGAQYVAGLWSDALIEGLAWQGLGERRPMSPDEYISPSWSWASFDGIAATGLSEGWKYVASVEDWHVEPKNEQNPHGQVKNAWIRVRGPVTGLRPSQKDVTEYEKKLQRASIEPLPRLHTRYATDEDGTVVSLDDRSPGEGWREMDLQVILLGGYKDRKGKEDSETKGDDDQLDYCYGLVVTKAEDSHGSGMKRVGWMFLPREEAAKVREDEECWRSVTLV